MTALSRVTGYVRDSFSGALFGLGWVADAYFMAFRIPNLLRDLFAEGALSQAFVPVLTRTRESGRRGPAEAREMTAQVFAMLTFVVGALVVAAILAAPWIVRFLAWGFSADPDKFALTVSLTRVLFPGLLFVSLAALWMGFLNACRRFTVAAFAPVTMNLTLIAAGVLLQTGWFEGRWGRPTALIHVWAVAQVFGLLFQWIVQIPEARKLGLTLRMSWPPRHPGVFAMLRQMGPVTVTLSTLQLNLLVNMIFGSFLATGGVASLYFGNRLMQLPLGVFGVSLATVSMPLLSSLAARRDERAFSRTLREFLEGAALLSFPCTVGAILVARPATRLAFEYGHFTPEATLSVAGVTSFYMLGLFGSIGTKVLNSAYYSRHATRWPFLAACLSVAVNFLMNLAALLFLRDPTHRLWALPAALTLAAFANMAFLFMGLGRAGVRLETGPLFAEWGRVALSTLGMAAVVWAVLRGLAFWPHPLSRVVDFVLPVVAGALVFFLLCRRLGCRSLHGFLLRRSGRTP
jgi:putative peptidoglycan lipid II flippase